MTLSQYKHNPFRDFLQAQQWVDTCKETLERAQCARDEAERSLLDHMQEEGIGSQTLDGFTVFATQTTRSRVAPGEMDALLAAMQALGLEGMATTSINANRLSAWVREMQDQEQQIPPELAGKIITTEITDVRVRKKG